MKNKIVKALVTKDDLVSKFEKIGIRRGMAIEVHSSLSSFGFVVGGACAVVDALLEAVGSEGTILMPLHMNDNSEPFCFSCPYIDIEIVDKVRKNMLPFEKKNSDSYKMGRIVENFRRREGVEISSHPTYPFVAKGRHAKFLCNMQSLHFPLSSESPIARLYELKGFCLLLGVDYDYCTAIHLSEYASECRPVIVQGAAMNVYGNVIWKEYLDLQLDSSDFLKPGKLMENDGKVSVSVIGDSVVKFFNVVEAVDYASRYFEKKIPYDVYR